MPIEGDHCMAWPTLFDLIFVRNKIKNLAKIILGVAIKNESTIYPTRRL